MAWGRIDDKFRRNEKIQTLRKHKGGMEALGVWLYWYSSCLEDTKLTGLVLKADLPARDMKAAEVLIEVGLWDDLGDEYGYHDFHKYNPTREQREAQKEADRQRKKGGISERIPSGIPNGFQHGKSLDSDLDSEPDSKKTLTRTRMRAGSGSGIDSSPESDRVEPDGSEAGHWLAAFGSAWATRRGWLTYGGGKSDATACSSLQAKLNGMPAGQRASAWSRRAEFFAMFFASTDPKVAAAGHTFAFFEPRFLGFLVPVAAPAKSTYRDLTNLHE